MKKIFTILLALVASVGMSWALTPLEGDTWDDATKTLTVNSNTGNSAYASQTEIKHLIVSDAVTELGWGTFFFDSLMTTVELGNNLEKIGISAFNECRSLSTITVPASVTSIGVRAFRNCTSLTTFTCEAVTPPTIGNAIFENDNNLTAIYVPAASVDAYKSAWSDYASLIEAIGGEPVLVTAYTLQLHVNDAAMGSVAVTNLLGSDIVDNGDGTYDVPEGAEVTLQATPNEGYEFIGWKASRTICDFADCEFVALPTVDNPLTFDMYAEAAIMAEFKASAPATKPTGTDTITWDNAFCMKVDAYYDGDMKSIVEENNEKDGIKVTFVGEEWDEGFTGDDIELYELSSILTFTSTVGNFQKIEIYYIKNHHTNPDGWTEDATNKKFVWEGTPAAAVNMQKGTGNVDFEVDRIVFIVESQGGTTAVENVQTNQVQGTKILRDGQLLIEKNGKTYNVMGAEVK